MSDYHARKAARREHYDRFVRGWKLRACTACSGSGRYDHNGSPDCGACDGTGKERVSPASLAAERAYDAAAADRNASQGRA
jgi:hypothetical protein